MMYIYMVSSENGNALYTGVTRNLKRRLYEHIIGKYDGFTKRYKAHKLVYYEVFEDPSHAILREKQLKRWSRKKKNLLVRTKNPNWEDLGKKLFPEMFDLIKKQSIYLKNNL